MSVAYPSFLLADIGGTHARFMLAPPDGPLPQPHIFKTGAFPRFETALAEFLRIQNYSGALRGIAVCAAGPVESGIVQFTNSPWQIGLDILRAFNPQTPPQLVNDFVAQAEGVLALGEGDVQRIGNTTLRAPDAPIGVLGPGTGLGVAMLVPGVDGHYRAYAGEGGHVDLPVTEDREYEVLKRLKPGHVHVSAERVLSGPGLERLYATLRAIDGATSKTLGAHEIDTHARAGDDPYASEAVRLFTGWLGAVAGNLALTIGAKGGIYLSGGILPRWGSLFDGDLFRDRFEAKGRFSPYMASIATALVLAPDIAFRGLRRLLVDL